MSRGLGGHSMGGYGTIPIGMKRPDVFSNEGDHNNRVIERIEQKVLPFFSSSLSFTAAKK